jgi:hypothetical protein
MLLRDAIFPVHKADDVQLHHVLLTRFNMRVFREHREIESPERLQEWVDHRLPIFLGVCLPSVTGQKRRPHRWLIGVDGMHPEMVEPLVSACAPWPWIEVVEQGADDHAAAPFTRALARVPEQATHLLTTRLDCDDALAVDHIQAVQAYTLAVLGLDERPDDFWLSMPLGAQLAGGEYSLYVHTTNHFLSRVVDASRAGRADANALYGKHPRLFDNGQPVFMPMTSTPMWLQNVHGQNALNRARDGAPAFASPGQIGQMFGLS